MRSIRAACALLLAAAPALAGGPMTSKTKAGPGAAVRAALSFSAPEGWRASERANGEDPVLEFSKGLDRITLRLYGSAGSAYPSPARFLRGPAATTMGQAPEAAGEVAVAGQRLPLYRRGFPLMLGDPHAVSPGLPQLGREDFVVMPLPGGRFAVASRAYESPVPALEQDAERAFVAFLKSLKPRK